MNKSNLSRFQANTIECQTRTCIVGKGASGAVVLGKHHLLKTVAVKCFSHGHVQLFMDELEILFIANHEHIARVYGFTQWPGSLGLVMEYYEGGSLGKLLENQKIEIHPSIRLRMALQVSKALAFLHNFSSTKSIVHGDVKPDNVLLTSDFNCKLCDFGLCTIVSNTIHSTGQTVRKGTRPYSAPEVLEGSYISSHTSQDVYSFAMLLFVLLTHRRETLEDWLAPFWVLMAGRPNCEVIETYKQSLPDDEAAIISLLQSVMKRCWAQSPTERPAMLQVRDELQKLYDQQNPCMVLIKVIQLCKRVNRDPEPANQEPAVPLDRFSAKESKFVIDRVATPPFAPDPNIDFSDYYNLPLSLLFPLRYPRFPYLF